MIGRPNPHYERRLDDYRRHSPALPRTRFPRSMSDCDAHEAQRARVQASLLAMRRLDRPAPCRWV